MRILAVGDSHCNPNFIATMFDRAKEFDCDRIFQVGDFGYWPKIRAGVAFINLVEAMVEDTGIPVYFCHGNHDDLEYLDVLTKKFGHDDFISIRDNVFYSPTGHSWEWDGMKFMSIGGAFSIRDLLIPITDQAGRPDTLVLGLRHKADGVREGYFEHLELLSDDDVARCQSRGTADVVFAHDVAARMPIDDLSDSRPDEDSRIISHNNRMAVEDAAFSNGSPSMFIHGHYHRSYSRTVDDTHFIGLSHDKGSKNGCIYVIDTEDFK